MAATINIDTGVFTNYLAIFAKTVVRTPITKTTSNVSGDETLTDGTNESIEVTFFKKDTVWAIQNAGLFEGADAIMLFNTSQTMIKDDKITYDSVTYRVDDVIPRKLGTTAIMNMARLFKI